VATVAGADDIIARVEREAGVPGLAAVLAERLSPTDLHSLLLEVTARRSGRRTPADVLADRRRDDALAPAHADARVLYAIVQVALEAAGAFEAVELSPICPQGLNTVLGRVDQKNVLATVRGSEVLADPTSALALECALRRRAGADAVRLCSIARVLRMQPFAPGLRNHFTLCGLASAGRSEPDHGFELAALVDHLTAHLTLVDRLQSRGYGIDDVLVRVADVAASEEPTPLLQRVKKQVFPHLRTGFPGADLRLDLTRTTGRGYYDGLMIDITIVAAGEARSVADGGTIDWAARLLSDRRERLFTSGIGIDRLVLPRAYAGDGG
jgi:hypothetical protein